MKAKQKLPKELRDVFKQMVDEYAYHALQLCGRNWVAYDVIAELVLSGWRPPDPASTSKNVEKSTLLVF